MTEGNCAPHNVSFLEQPPGGRGIDIYSYSVSPSLFPTLALPLDQTARHHVWT